MNCCKHLTSALNLTARQKCSTTEAALHSITGLILYGYPQTFKQIFVLGIKSLHDSVVSSVSHNRIKFSLQQQILKLINL